MNFNLEDLRIFLAVVEARGITAAAGRLHRVPSNVTTRLRQLEAELGVPLFHREQQRLTLAAAGRLFQPYAEHLLRLAAAAGDALQDPAPRGELHLGAMDSVAATRLPQPLADYHRRHPRASVHLVTGPTQQLVAQVLTRKLEAAIVADPPPDERLESLPLFTEELVLLAPAGHPPVRTPRDLRYHTLLTFGRGCAYRRILEHWFARHHRVPERISELDSYHAILGCVSAGMGLALVPRVLVAPGSSRRAFSLHPLPSGLGRVDISLVWRRQEDSPRLHAFRALLTTDAPSRNRGAAQGRLRSSPGAAQS